MTFKEWITENRVFAGVNPNRSGVSELLTALEAVWDAAIREERKSLLCLIQSLQHEGEDRRHESQVPRRRVQGRSEA